MEKNINLKDEDIKKDYVRMDSMFGISYKVFGSSDIMVVVDSALGSCSAEWWHIAEELSEKYKVLLYDRVGYGTSKSSEKERTPENIVAELKQLIDNVRTNEKLILVGHSQGGFYVAQYAAKYLNEVNGIILLDPATPYDKEFSSLLSAEEFKNSGVDKTKALKLQKKLAHFGIIKLLKGLLKKSPPFHYFQYSKEAQDYILESLYKEKTYDTAINEYFYTHKNQNIEYLKKAIDSQALDDIPVMILTHSSAIYCEELMKYGGMDLESAKKVEKIWQELMCRYKNISRSVQHITANNSGHFIHLTDLELLKNSIKKMAGE